MLDVLATMSVTIILIVALLGFRLMGQLGIDRFSTWQASAAHALAVMLVITGSAHFVPAGGSPMPDHADLVSMVPPLIPFPDLAVYATGVLELLGAAGLVLTSTRRPAGLCLAALFVLLLPANVYAAVADVPFNGAALTPLWIRIPEQVLYIAIALWAASATSHVLEKRPSQEGEPGAA